MQDAYKLMEKLIKEKKLTQAADVWKTLDYETCSLQASEAIMKLKMFCKVRDKQIEKLIGGITKTTTLKACAELLPNDKLELFADYQATTIKCEIAENAEIKQLKLQNEQLENRIAKLQNDLKLKDEASDASARKIKMENIKKGQTAPSAFAVPSEPQYGTLESFNEKDQQQDSTLNINSIRYSALISENAQNKVLIKELMENKESVGSAKVSKVLYDANTELNNKVGELSGEIDSTKMFIEEISVEQAKTMATLIEILQQKDISSNRQINQNENTQNLLIAEVKIAKDINTLVSEILRSVHDSEINVNTEKIKNFQEQLVPIKSSANIIYREFYEDKNSWKCTIEALQERLKKKDSAFKELFTLFEELASQNDELISNKQHSPAKSSEEKNANDSSLGN